MFQGSAVEYLNATEADGAPVETTQDGVVVAHLVTRPAAHHSRARATD